MAALVAVFLPGFSKDRKFYCFYGPIKSAVDQSIDVIIMNLSAAEQAREVGAFMYVGQSE